MSINVQEIEMLNKKVQILNEQRQKILGMKEQAKLEYEKAVSAYKMKYGVELTPENLQVEYNNENAKLQEDAQKLKEMITNIESGVYKQSTNIGVTPQADASVNPQYQVQQNENIVPMSSPASFVQMTNNAQVQPQVGVNNVQSASVPVQPTQCTGETQADEDVSEAVFTPQGWGIPNKSNINANYTNTEVRFGQ